ncbi:RPOM-like protein [Mya arenaria]|uniref:DNA-directed RNA polymerase n=1 Tax=Mya arenaria TaxID=6604 RepID=A0ABY7F219_MYAAR|nr:RPOM-like protein [Mya arenaria]
MSQILRLSSHLFNALLFENVSTCRSCMLLRSGQIRNSSNSKALEEQPYIFTPRAKKRHEQKSCPEDRINTSHFQLYNRQTRKTETFKRNKDKSSIDCDKISHEQKTEKTQPSRNKSDHRLSDHRQNSWKSSETNKSKFQDKFKGAVSKSTELSAEALEKRQKKRLKYLAKKTKLKKALDEYYTRKSPNHKQRDNDETVKYLGVIHKQGKGLSELFLPSKRINRDAKQSFAFDRTSAQTEGDILFDFLSEETPEPYGDLTSMEGLILPVDLEMNSLEGVVTKKAKKKREKTNRLNKKTANSSAISLSVRSEVNNDSLLDYADACSSCGLMLKAVMPDYEPNLPTFHEEYEGPLLDGLNTSLSASEKVDINPFAGVFTSDEVRQRAERQFNIELDGNISMKSIFNTKKKMDVFRENEIKILEKQWQSSIQEMFVKKRQDQVQLLASKNVKTVTLLPFLCVLPTEDYVNIMVKVGVALFNIILDGCHINTNHFSKNTPAKYVKAFRKIQRTRQDQLKTEVMGHPVLSRLMNAESDISLKPWEVPSLCPMLEVVMKIFKSGGDPSIDIPQLPDNLPTPDKLDKSKLEGQDEKTICLRKFTQKPTAFGGVDFVRCLLVFAKGKPLGSSGLDWLKLHLMNLSGLLKRASYKEKLAHVETLMPEILDSAQDPLGGNGWWKTLDDPFQCLSTCMEIANAVNSGDPSQFISYLPIHQDGSCNGLQHYAALGRDNEGARSIARQLGYKEFPEKELRNAARYLMNKTFLCLKKLFFSAKDIQKWFDLCSLTICRKTNKPVEWVTPLYFPVLQCYYKTQRTTVKGRMLEIRESQYLKVDSQRQKNGFAPNFIHSLDATHMALTALYCHRKGITFSAVHDCFWTHASSVDVMNITREQFVALHNQPILDNLSKHFLDTYIHNGDLSGKDREILAAILSKVPHRGTFDLNNVMHSTYFFS